MKYKFYKEQGILECYVYSIKNADIEKKILEDKQNEKLGIDIDDENAENKIYGEPIEMVVNFKELGDPIFFTPNKVELYEEFNFEEGIHVEFSKDLDFVFLISFEEFKELYFEYKGITNGN